MRTYFFIFITFFSFLTFCATEIVGVVSRDYTCPKQVGQYRVSFCEIRYSQDPDFLSIVPQPTNTWNSLKRIKDNTVKFTFKDSIKFSKIKKELKKDPKVFKVFPNKKYKKSKPKLFISTYLTTMPLTKEYNLSNKTFMFIPINKTITKDTVLSLKYTLNSVGNMHAVGFTNKRVVDYNTTFKLSGTTRRGIMTYKNKHPYNKVNSVNIPVGKHFQGTYKYLVLINKTDYPIKFKISDLEVK